MTPNSMTEAINKGAAKLWVWLTSFLAYVVSIIFPIIGSNVEKWLKPFLISINAPDFLKSDFTVYATIYGVCGFLTTKAIGKLITLDVRYKSQDYATLRTLKKENRELKISKLELERRVESLNSEHSQSLADKADELEQKKEHELGELKRQHAIDIKIKDDDHERECKRLNEYIKLQDIAFDAMKNYKAVESDIRYYNNSTKRSFNHMQD